MKQTAVEWLVEQITNKVGYYSEEVQQEIYQQAKAMEKNQSLELIELTSQLTGAATVDKEIAEMEYIDVYNQYYNENFKTE